MQTQKVQSASISGFMCKKWGLIVLAALHWNREQMAESLMKHTDVRMALVVGGLSMNTQAASLRSRPEIVVGTAGRIIDHIRNSQSVGFESLATLVLDEADRLLELGFRDELEELLKALPPQRQTMLFSATLTQVIFHFCWSEKRIKYPFVPCGSVAPKSGEEETRRKWRVWACCR